MCLCLYKTYNHVFPGQIDNSCSEDKRCQYPMKCIDETCICPTNTYHVSFIDEGRRFHRCIPNGGTLPFTNSV